MRLKCMQHIPYKPHWCCKELPKDADCGGVLHYCPMPQAQSERYHCGYMIWSTMISTLRIMPRPMVTSVVVESVLAIA
jgi:hypothetical protein